MTEDDFRQIILKRLLERNARESGFQEIISSSHRMLERHYELKSENLAITLENEKLRKGVEIGAGDPAAVQRMQTLEKKLLEKQEELMDLHKRKSEHQQLLIDLNVKVSDLQKQLEQKNLSFNEQSKVNQTLKAEVQMFTVKVGKLEELNSTLKDEYTAQHLLLSSLEDKLKKAQAENGQLLERLMKFKAKDAEKMNEENETFLRKKNDAMKRELAEAMGNDPNSMLSPTTNEEAYFSGTPNVFFGDEIPNKVHLKFDCNDGEVNAVKWSPLERMIATGGADRKVKLWDVNKGNSYELRGNLVGSNQAVNSLDFDSTGTLILASSNDYASRVWGINDHRLRVALTGHSAKVMAAKFLGDSQKIVTGSHDRTIKIWDLRNKACIETKFAGSSCNDLVTTDSSTIISGHFDKKIRFWDVRSSSSDTTSDIQLQGKVTSLDLSKDCKLLATCMRDDTIKIIDLRTNQILTTLCHDGFKVGCDFSRISFNSDWSCIAAGSSDGSVFIWNIDGKLVSILKDHTAAVQAVSFHPFSSVLASVDRAKRCTIWTHV